MFYSDLEEGLGGCRCLLTPSCVWRSGMRTNLTEMTSLASSTLTLARR